VIYCFTSNSLIRPNSRLRNYWTYNSASDKLQEWDHTNFLVDLAGHYANCDNLRTTGVISVDRRTPEGETISGFVDNIDGTATDVNAVNGYIRSLVDRWTRARTYNSMVLYYMILYLTTLILDCYYYYYYYYY